MFPIKPYDIGTRQIGKSHSRSLNEGDHNIKKLIGLNERIALLRVELREFLHAKSLDQSRIAQKMGEISALCLEKKTLRLDNWFEIQKILKPEQQKKWTQALQMKIAGKARPREGFDRRSMVRGRGKIRERRSWNQFE